MKLPLLWTRLEALMKPAERMELRHMVGEAVVARCEDLREEMQSVESIMTEFRASCSPQVEQLADGPARELLEQKVTMLLERLGENYTDTAERDLRIRKYLTRENEKTKSLTKQDDFLDIDEIRPFLDIDHITPKVSTIQAALEAEAVSLAARIDAMHNSFTTTSVHTYRPSLTDLRQYAARLEDLWLRRDHQRAVSSLLSTHSSSHQLQRTPSSSLRQPPHHTPTLTPPGEQRHTTGLMQQRSAKSKLRTRLREARDESHFLPIS